MFILVWTALVEIVSNSFVCVFMSSIEAILAIEPGIIRGYVLSFMLLPFNIFSTYFRIVMKPAISFAVSVSRGDITSSSLIFILPAVFGEDATRFSMPVTGLLIVFFGSENDTVQAIRINRLPQNRRSL